MEDAPNATRVAGPAQASMRRSGLTPAAPLTSAPGGRSIVPIWPLDERQVGVD